MVRELRSGFAFSKDVHPLSETDESVNYFGEPTAIECIGEFYRLRPRNSRQGDEERTGVEAFSSERKEIS